MNRYILLIALSCLLLTSGTCKKEEGEPPPYFECDYYHYFPDDGFPVLTPEDSAATAEFLVSSGIYNKYQLEQDRDNVHIFYYLPIIKNTVDTALFNSFMFGLKNKEKPIYGSLNWGKLTGMILSDAIIIGDVVDFIYLNDTSKCFHYKSMMVLQVEKILHSKFPLKKGDFILCASLDGYEGGCVQGGENIYSFFTHTKMFKKGERDLFFIKKQLYRSFFIRNYYATGVYDDVFCENIFTISNKDENSLRITNEQQLKDVIKFCRLLND